MRRNFHIDKNDNETISVNNLIIKGSLHPNFYRKGLKYSPINTCDENVAQNLDKSKKDFPVNILIIKWELQL